MGRFAEKTVVSSDRSRAEIEKTLSRYGATSFMYGWNEGNALIVFEMHGRRIKFNLPLPDKNDKSFTLTPSGRKRKEPKQIEEAFEMAVRQKWRALNLVVKAKLEAVDSGITCFEHEFMAHILLPDGQSVGDFMTPQIDEAYKNGKMPLMLNC